MRRAHRRFSSVLWPRAQILAETESKLTQLDAPLVVFVRARPREGLGLKTATQKLRTPSQRPPPKTKGLERVSAKIEAQEHALLTTLEASRRESNTVDAELLKNLLQELSRDSHQEERAMALLPYVIGGKPRPFNLLIGYLAQTDRVDKALSVLGRMIDQGIAPNAYTFSPLMSACAREGSVEKGFDMLALMDKHNVTPDLVVWTGLANVCAKAGDVDRAFEVLERMQLGGISPDVVFCNSLMHACASKADMHRAWTVLDIMKRNNLKLDGKLLATLADACIRANEDKKALELLHLMEDQEVAPHLHFFNALLKACVSDGNITQAYDLMHTIRQYNLEPDSTTYLTLLTVCAKAKDQRAAAEVVERVKAKGIPMDVRFWTCLVDLAAQRGDVRRAFETLVEMQNAGVQPNRITYNTLINVCAEAGRVEDALYVMEVMVGKGIQPDTFASASFIKACIKAQHYDKALDLLRGRQQGKGVEGGVDVCGYNTLLLAFAKECMHSKALEVWDLMETHGVKPDLLSYKFFIRSLLAADEASGGGSKKTWALLEEMKRDGVQPDSEMLEAVLQGMGAQGGRLRLALQLVEDMEERGVRPDQRVCASLALLYARWLERRQQRTAGATLSKEERQREKKNRRTAFKKVLRVLRRVEPRIRAEEERRKMWVDILKGLISRGHKKVAKKFLRQADKELMAVGEGEGEGVLLQRCKATMSIMCATGAEKRGVALLEEMKKRGTTPPRQIFESLLQLCKDKGNVERALWVLQHMQADGLALTQGDYLSLIDTCKKAKVPEGSFEVLNMMEQSGGHPTQLILEALIDACSQQQQLQQQRRTHPKGEREDYIDRAMRILLRMQEASYPPSLRTYKHVLRMCAQVGNSEKALAILDVIKEAGLQPNEAVYAYLIECFATQGNKEKALETLERMKVSRVVPARRAYHAALRACAQAKDTTALLSMFEKMTAKEGEGGEEITPNRITYNHLIRGHLRVNELDKAYTVMEQRMAKEGGLTPQVDTFKLFVNYFFGRRDIEESFNAVKQFRKAGMVVNADVVAAVAECVMKANEGSKVASVLELAREGGIVIPKTVHKALVSLGAKSVNNNA